MTYLGIQFGAVLFSTSHSVKSFIGFIGDLFMIVGGCMFIVNAETFFMM